MAARAFDVDRSSVWIYDDARSKIVCANLYERRSHEHTAGLELQRVDYPRYFDALAEERAIAANDARTDPKTREFTETYLDPLGITSMLDAPIQSGGECLGVLCLEHVGPRRTWTQEEESFVASLADFAALAIETEQRRQAEDLLREREQELRLALEAASMGTWSFDLADGRVVWSKEAALIFQHNVGWSPKTAGAYLELVHPEDTESVRDVFQQLSEGPVRPFYLQHRVVFEDASIRWIEIKGQAEQVSSGRPRRILGTISDQTERHELERQLLHSQKLEALGLLAGGIAHDFNNLLTAMSGYSEILLDDRSLTEDQRSSIGFISDASTRAKALTGQLLAFSRRQPLQVVTLDVNDLVEGVADLLQRLIGERVKLEIDVGAQRLVRADARQIEQILTNLSINARDAMPDGGRLTISTRSIDPAKGAGEPVSKGAGHVSIEVADTGVGVPDEIVSRIFEPFFTTKPPAKGSGLGLSTCYGIAKQAGGDLVVEKRPEGGTIFRLVLPAVDDTAVEPTPVGDAARGRAPREETILVVEDDELVRRLTVSVLEREGYRVVVASSGEEASEIVREGDVPIDLVVTDLVLPGRSGIEVVAEIRSSRSDMPALFVSGYLADSIDGHHFEEGEFLQKPYRATDLTARVRRLLDAAASG